MFKELQGQDEFHKSLKNLSNNFLDHENMRKVNLYKVTFLAPFTGVQWSPENSGIIILFILSLIFEMSSLVVWLFVIVN